MSGYIAPIDKLINQLIRLPGIGRRSAERIVSYIIEAPLDEIKRLSEAILRVKENVRFCRICHNLSEQEECFICRDPKRNRSILCIVERPNDVNCLEKTGVFNGLYHVLMGSIAPLEGKGPSELKIDDLLARIKQNNIQEVIIATDSDTEGEATALYLTNLIKPLGIRLTRIGLGLPVGANLEYADLATLSKALESRQLL